MIVQKKAILVVKFRPNNYIPFRISEPIFQNLKIFNMNDIFTLKKLKFPHKLAHNTLPTYLNFYRQFRKNHNDIGTT